MGVPLDYYSNDVDTAARLARDADDHLYAPDGPDPGDLREEPLGPCAGCGLPVWPGRSTPHYGWLRKGRPWHPSCCAAADPEYRASLRPLGLW